MSTHYGSGLIDKTYSGKVNKSFQGYPQISLSYFGESSNQATE